MNKSVLKSVILSLGVLAAPFALSAKTTEQAYIESFKGRTDIPVPVAVVKPSISAAFVGKVVKLEFVVDAAGNVTNIAPVSTVPAALADSLTVAVAQWKFAPARNAAGEAVSMKVQVPFRVTEPSSYAMN